MKHSLLMTIFVSIITLGTFAQEPQQRTEDGEHPTRRPRAEMHADEIARLRTERLSQRLGLSEEQQKQVYQLELANAEKMKAEREALKARMEERRAEREIWKARLNEILTEEQRAALEKEQSERPKRVNPYRVSPAHGEGVGTSKDASRMRFDGRRTVPRI